MPRHLAYARLGQHRNNPRLWLQGRRLEDCGAQPGVRFDLHADPASKSLTIVLSPTGARRVSGKTMGGGRIPIIDINSSLLADVFGPADRVRVVFDRDTISVTLHPDAAAEAERRERIEHRLRQGKPLRMGSLFHGGGILDHALHSGLAMAGVKTALSFAVELEQRYLDASLRNNPVWARDGLAVNGSVDDIDPRSLGRVEMLVAGIPCTGASLSGRARRGLVHAESHPDAGHLFVAFLAVVKATQPAVVVIENVAQYANTAAMEAIRGSLRVLGYDLSETVLDGNELGALENRKRLCAVAVTKGLSFSFDGLTPVRRKEATVAEVLDPTADGWSEMAGLIAKQARDKARYADQGHGTGFKMQVLEASATSVPVIGRCYSKVRSTEPKMRHPTDKRLLRQFTPAEHARIKGIPFSLVAGEVPSIQHQILGQSVCWPAFAAVGRHLGRALAARRAVDRPARSTVGKSRALPHPAILAAAAAGPSQLALL